MSSLFLLKQSQNNLKKRDDYFDILRAIAIIFVIAIHTFNRIPGIDNSKEFHLFASIWSTIVSCAVPLFLAISGYFMANKKIHTKTEYLKFIKKQVPRVYIPCFIFSLPYFYWEVKANGFRISELLTFLWIFGLLLCIINNNPIPLVTLFTTNGKNNKRPCFLNIYKSILQTRLEYYWGNISIY